MKYEFIKYLVNVFALICEIQHKVLPDKTDEKLQELFIKIIGYHCPFTTWSFWLDTKFNIGEWKPTDGKSEP
jgi:hypothetical protein